MDKEKAEKYGLALAQARDLVKGAYVPTEWIPALKKDFPYETSDMPDRWGFNGEEDAPEVWTKYVGKRVSDEYRKRGAAFPIRYCGPK